MDNKEFVKYFYENIVSKNELDKLSQFISKECISRSGENIVNIGLEGMKKHLEDVKKTYPDYTMKIIRQYLDGEYVVSEFIMQGTHKGEFAGIKPTDRILTFIGINIDRVVDGRIIEHGGATNTFETLLENKLITGKTKQDNFIEKTLMEER